MKIIRKDQLFEVMVNLKYNHNSLNIMFANAKAYETKKRVKLLVTEVVAGESMGALHNSWSFLNLTKSDFIEIHKPLEERLM